MVKFRILFIVVSYVIFNYPKFNNYDVRTDKQGRNTRIQINSSAWCVGNNSSDRFCNFKDICYSTTHREFVLFHGINSVISGIPNDRFQPTLAELSSVVNHNVHYFNYVDMPSQELDTNSINFIEQPTLLFNRFYPDNLMHVFHDDILPLYSTLSMICKEPYNNKCKLLVFLFDKNSWGPFEGLYKTLFVNITQPSDLSTSQIHCFRELYVGVNKQTVWYQYGFKVPQGPVQTNPRSQTSLIIQQFKKYFLDVFLPKTSTDSENIAVILIRKKNRRILNLKTVVELVSTITKLRVEVLNLEEYTLTEIVSFIQHAEVLVGMHGSLLILSLFLKPNSVVIELFPYAVNPSRYTPYKTLAGIPSIDLVYKSWWNVLEENTFTHPDNPPSTGGISNRPRKEQESILASKEVPLHLCCDNPEWLFRIYQDTVVDLASFEDVLESALREQNQQTLKGENVDKFRDLFPSKVVGAACYVNVTAQTLNVEWKKPWNLDYFHVDVLEYEMWIQNFDNNEDVKAYVLTRTSHAFQNVNVDFSYLMWVRCIADTKQGPFINAVTCIRI